MYMPQNNPEKMLMIIFKGTVLRGIKLVQLDGS